MSAAARLIAPGTPPTPALLQAMTRDPNCVALSDAFWSHLGKTRRQEAWVFFETVLQVLDLMHPAAGSAGPARAKRALVLANKPVAEPEDPSAAWKRGPGQIAEPPKLKGEFEQLIGAVNIGDNKESLTSAFNAFRQPDRDPSQNASIKAELEMAISIVERDLLQNCLEDFLKALSQA